jgi:hypothetical protein
VDASQEVGSRETQVSVPGTAPPVDTISPVLSGLIDDRRVVDLPLNGRNVMSLAGILPGVLAVAVPQQMDNARSGPIMDVNGGRSNMNLFTFNGGYFNNPSRNTGIDYPPPDAIGITEKIATGHGGSARRRGQQRGQHPQRRGLARAVGPEKTDDLAGADGEIDAANRLHNRFSRSKSQRQARGFDHACCTSLSVCRLAQDW